MSIFTFPSPGLYGQNVPAQPMADQKTVAAENLINTLLLADLTQCGTDEKAILSCAKKLMAQAEKIEDPEMRRVTVFTLAKIQKSPDKLTEIRNRHLQQISTRFEKTAFAARDAKRYNDALVAIQIAVRCNPANARARLLFASLITPEKAVQTLYYGVQFLDLQSEIAPTYFNKYFQALSDLQQDRTVAKQALSLLTNKSLPEPVRIAIANHAAMSLYWFGSYENCIRILEEQKIAETQQGMILKSRALFDLRRNKEAIDLLEKNLLNFPAEKRDVILSQLSRYYQALGDNAAALEIANRRIAENPTSPTPYLQRLYLYDKFGDKEKFIAELASILETFSASQTALVTLANFAAEHGKYEIARVCLQLAVKNRFQPGIFAATIIESLITADRPEEAISNYIEMTKATPKLFEGMETSVNAILAAAYAKIARDGKELSEEQRAAALEHANLLVTQYTAEKAQSPDNFISVTNLFRKTHDDEFALKIALAGTHKFPWHSQLRANALSLRLKLGKISGGNEFAPIQDEIRTLANMRRPSPEIWKEIALWLATSSGIPKSDIDSLRAVVTPLIRSDIVSESFKEY